MQSRHEVSFLSHTGIAVSFGLAVIVLASGCISLDATPVEQARAAVESARSEANIEAGSLDLEQAERHLALAEEALESGGFQVKVDHEAYMAVTYARVAQVQGEAHLAREETSAYLARARGETTRTRMQVESAIRFARALDAQQTERGLVLTLGGVQFAFDSADLKPEAQLSVARVAGFLIASDNREVLVEGYTDNIGEEDYNLDLSKRRAESVRDALIENRISMTRILADGFGAAFPLASNEDEEGRQTNRRVEIVILEPGQAAADFRRSGGLPDVAADRE
jgi:outer membrane protein OmpA-like peptidoglycan-associated protein